MTDHEKPTDDSTDQPWLLTQETPGLDPEPIREEAGPDWPENPPDIGHPNAETIDESDVETAAPEGDADRSA